jgi:hypothetical protein
MAHRKTRGSDLPDGESVFGDASTNLSTCCETAVTSRTSRAAKYRGSFALSAADAPPTLS